MGLDNLDRINKMISDYHHAFENGDIVLAQVIKNALLSKHGIHICPSEEKPLNRLKLFRYR